MDIKTLKVFSIISFIIWQFFKNKVKALFMLNFIELTDFLQFVPVLRAEVDRDVAPSDQC